MAKLRAFVETYSNVSKRIDVSITNSKNEKIAKNREILKSIIQSLLYCGHQGISLRSHRDDETNKDQSLNMGNFKELLSFRAEAGDTVLDEHLKYCAKNASYIYKTSQNELLSCMKKYVQDRIVQEISAQSFGPYYGLQCDEVTDASNWEQLGVVVRYVANGKPVERLLEFVQCEEVTGLAICDSIINCLRNVRLDPQNCRSLTTDGAGNMAGKNIGAVKRFKEHSPRTVYHYCSSHDLNLAICKSSKVKEIQICLDTLKKLGIFFKYSPKRSRRLEKAIDEVNESTTGAKIEIKKFKVFTETRWVEKHSTLKAFDDLYEPIMLCLEAISTKERNWDSKAVVEATGLQKKLSESVFIASFQTILHYFGYMAGLSRKLQGSTLDISQGYKLVENVRNAILATRSDDSEFDQVYNKMHTMATLAGMESLDIPRLCIRQTQRSNTPAASAKEYFKRSVFLPYLDTLIDQLNMRFTDLSDQSTKALLLIPSNISNITQADIKSVKEGYGPDMPEVSFFDQELVLWRQMWRSQTDPPSTLEKTLQDPLACTAMFPNITTTLCLMLLTSVTSSSVERANSSLRFVKNYLRTTMTEERFNALILLFIHKDIKVDIDTVIDMFATRNSRRILLENPTAAV